MAVERAFLKIPVYRGDYEPYLLEFYDSTSGTSVKVDVATVYDEIILEVRDRPAQDSRLRKRLTLTDGDFTISDTNIVSFNLNMVVDGGVYYFDLRLRLTGTSKWLTLISGTVVITNSISRIS